MHFILVLIYALVFLASKCCSQVPNLSHSLCKLRFKVKPKSVFLLFEFGSKDFKDCHMLTGLFQKMLRKADATASASSASDLEGHKRSNDRIGLEDFQRLVGTYEFRSYLQTRGTFGFLCVWSTHPSTHRRNIMAQTCMCNNIALYNYMIYFVYLRMQSHT